MSEDPDRRMPKPPSPDDLAEVEQTRLEPEPLEPRVEAPVQESEDDREGSKPTGQ